MKRRELTGMTVSEFVAPTQAELFKAVAKFAKEASIESISLQYEPELGETAVVVWT